MNLKAVMFDLDGVLLNSCQWHHIALNQALLEETNDSLSFEDMAKYEGMLTKKKLDVLAEKGLIPIERLPVILARKNFYTHKLIEAFVSYDHTKSTLMKYIREKNMLLACVSNTNKNNINKCLNYLGISQFFHLIVSSQDIGASKPDPAPYIYTAHQLKVTKDECIIVEDSDIGIQAAIAFGSRVWKVKNANQVTLENFKQVVEL